MLAGDNQSVAQRCGFQRKECNYMAISTDLTCTLGLLGDDLTKWTEYRVISYACRH
jgi:hypothetical protein